MLHLLHKLKALHYQQDLFNLPHILQLVHLEEWEVVYRLLIQLRLKLKDQWLQMRVHLHQTFQKMWIQEEIKDSGQVKSNKQCNLIKTRLQQCLKLNNLNYQLRDNLKCLRCRTPMLLIEEIKQDLLQQEDQCLHLHQFLGNNLHKPKDQVFHHLNSNQLLPQWAVPDPDLWQQIFLHLLKVHQWEVLEEVKLILDHRSMPKH